MKKFYAILISILIAISISAQQPAVPAITTSVNYQAKTIVYVTASDVDPLNRYILIYFNNGVYSYSNHGGVKTTDLQLTFSQNGGTATNAVISSVKNISNADLVGDETTIRVNITITGSASGVETVEIKPVSGISLTNNVFDRSPILSNTITCILNKTYDTDYQAVLSYQIDTNQGPVPSYKYRTIENQWVIDVKATGKWTTSDRIDRLSKYANISYALLDWKTPGTHTLTNVNLPWTKNTGFTFGSPNYLDTDYTPSAGVNFTLNNGGIFHACETNVSTGNNDYGVNHSDGNASKWIACASRAGGDVASIALNTAIGNTNAGITSSIGTFLNNRTGPNAADHDFYWNAALIDGTNFASLALPNQNMVIGGVRFSTGLTGSFTTRRVSLFIIGASMLDKVTELNTAETTYVASNAAVTYDVQLTTDNGITLTTDTPTNLKTD